APALGGHLGAADRDPARRVGRRLARRFAEVPRRTLEVAFVHRAAAARHRRRRAAREQHAEQRQRRRGTPTPMTKDLLQTILGRSPSVEDRKKAFETKDGHELSFYLGTPGQAMVVSEVKRVVLEAAHVEVGTGDRRTIYVPYESVIGIAAKA